MKKLIIIPAYNEEENIERTIKMIEKGTNDFDYVIINDCSKDNTKKICEENHFNYVDLPINLGIGGAVQTGYKYALNNGYDLAVQVDGDGQHDPQLSCGKGRERLCRGDPPSGSAGRGSIGLCKKCGGGSHSWQRIKGKAVCQILLRHRDQREYTGDRRFGRLCCKRWEKEPCHGGYGK